jgi:hypothetical protein
MTRSRRSAHVSLLLLGSAATLAGCSSGADVALHQQRYASREDCLRDWNSERDCQTTGMGTGGYGGFGGYYGPRYYWDPSRGQPIVVERDGSERAVPGARVSEASSAHGETVSAGRVTRGGFGSMGRGFSRGG